jgi:hypothetical protein
MRVKMHTFFVKIAPKQLVRDLEKHLKDMEFLQASIEDGTRRPVFLLQKASPCEGIIVDAEA